MSERIESPSLDTPCRNLRNKEMYYGGAEDDPFASGICWCLKTHESVGPDGQPVTRAECKPGRPCYCGV
jgi:hypothetical protein